MGDTSSSLSGGGGHYPHDVRTQSGLTSIYNERVVHAEHMNRNMTGIPKVQHEGVRLTTESGHQYLVHKGPDFGKSSQTVVVDAKHMNPNTWQRASSTPVSSGMTVGDAVKIGGPGYNVLTGDHCQTAAERIYNKAKK